MINFAVDGAGRGDVLTIRHGDAGEVDLFRMALKGFQMSSTMEDRSFEMIDLFSINEITPPPPNWNGVAYFEGQRQLRTLLGTLTRSNVTLPIILRAVEDPNDSPLAVGSPMASDLPPPVPRAALPPREAFGVLPRPSSPPRALSRAIPRGVPHPMGVPRDSLSDDDIPRAILPPRAHRAPMRPPSPSRGAAAGSPHARDFSRVGHFTTLAIRAIAYDGQVRFPQAPIYTAGPGSFRYVGVYNDSMGKPIPAQLKALMMSCRVYVEDINRDNYQGYNDCGYWSALNLMYLCRCRNDQFGSELIARKVHEFYHQMEAVYASNGGRRNIIPPHYTRTLPEGFEWKYNSAILRICIAYFAYYYMQFYDPSQDPFTIKQNISLPDYVGECNPEEFPI